MKYRLGLDLGTNSIGWTALDMADPETPRILDMGVRIFPDGREAKTGTPLNEGRRTARQMRRQRDRKIRRKNDMLRFLVNNRLLPKDGDERRAIARLDPYELRAAALERKLKPYELGRIMMQFSIHRGFKSSRKDRAVQNDAEQAGMLGGIKALESELRGLTLGQWLYERKKKNDPVRFKARMEKTKAVYASYPSRQMYEAEFAAIKKKQEKFFKDLNWDRLHWIIFFQRPLKPPERGICQFYPEEKRGYKAFVSAHRFRILQDINNLKYYNAENRQEEISPALKSKLFEELDSKKSLSFDRIRKIFGEGYDGTFNLENSKRSGLKGNETSVDFRRSEFFGPPWDSMDTQTQDRIVETLMLEDDETVLKNFLEPFKLSEAQIKNILGYNLPTGTVMLSSRFMIACSGIMLKEQLLYNEAVKRLGLHHSHKEKPVVQSSLPYYGKILSAAVSGAKGEQWDGPDEERYGRITNPTVHIALNQLRKLVNTLIRRFGGPAEIILEIARDLKAGKFKKDEIFREQAQNQRDNERIKKELTALGFMQISGEDIKKYKLWEELAPEGLARCCPYCGRPISAKQLFEETVEIEHILPYSRTLLNSRDNLTVAHRKCNQDKGGNTPFEAFGHSPGTYNWDSIIERAAKLPSKKRNKFSPDDMTRFHEESEGFMDKQLHDTAYLSRASKDYLAAICDRNSIWVSSGKLTAILRRFWGFNTILSRGHDTGFKNRNDHRHHALDSLTIGLCDRGLIAKAAHINSGRRYREIGAPPCPIPRKDIEKRLSSIIVSYKPDHGVEGKMYAETALAKRSYVEEISPDDLQEHEINRIIPKSIQQHILGLVKEQGFRKAKKALQGKYKYLRVFRDKWVTRTPVESLSERDIPNICDPAIRKQIHTFITKYPGQKLPEVLSKFSEKTNIRSVRYFPKDQVPVPIESCGNKAYMPGDYYRVDIWKIPRRNEEFKYEGVFISRPEAMRRLADKENSAPVRKPHPAAKLVMSLCKNDVIELSNETVREFCRIAGFSTTNNRVDIRPIYASDTIAAWMKDTNIHFTSPFWPHDCEGQLFRSINTLFSDYQVKQIKITVDGRFFYRS
jgi:CRISPR-associated endonuclease Csn1